MKKTCVWLNTPDYWETNCGEEFYLMEGGLEENNYKYCPNCGKKIVEQYQIEEDEHCRHVFLYDNGGWYCNESLFPVEEFCRMACFTGERSSRDNAQELRERLEEMGMEDD